MGMGLTVGIMWQLWPHVEGEIIVIHIYKILFLVTFCRRHFFCPCIANTGTSPNRNKKPKSSGPKVDIISILTLFRYSPWDGWLIE